MPRRRFQRGSLRIIGDKYALFYHEDQIREPYLKVIRENCSEALHILDRFHIVAKMNKALDEVRAGESRRIASEGRTPLLKKSPLNRTRAELHAQLYCSAKTRVRLSTNANRKLSLTAARSNSRVHVEAILVREPINKIHSACASELTSRSSEPKGPPKRLILFLIAASQNC